MSIIISAETLHEKLQQENIVPIDVRIKDKLYATGKKAYEHAHIPNAIYLDFKEDLSGNETFFPPVEQIRETLESHGIDRQTKIVFYDEGNHRAASKGYVLLTYLGHEHTYILDGGAQAWHDAGYEWTAEIPKRTITTYDIHVQHDLLAQIEDVKKSIHKTGSVHIDSRVTEKYTGEVDSGYGKAGHIPGARNFPAKQVFDEKGKWQSQAILQKHFAPIQDNEEQIVSCGSGNSACMNVVALKEAGYQNVKLFAGGFSEWIEDETNEIEKSGD